MTPHHFHFPQRPIGRERPLLTHKSYAPDSGISRASNPTRQPAPPAHQLVSWPLHDSAVVARRVDPDHVPPLRVLVVDDDAPVRNACSEIAKSLGFATQSADSVSTARLALANSSIDILLLDLKLPGGGGLSLLEDIRARHPQTIVVIMTAFASVTSAVESMRIGAGDYLTKPFTLEELSTTLDRAAQRRSFDVESRILRDRLRAGAAMGNLVGNSPAMIEGELFGHARGCGSSLPPPRIMLILPRTTHC